MLRYRNWLATLAAAALLGVGGGSRAEAAVVTSTADSGPGSLCQAIAFAASGETITFSLSLPAHIVLESELLINKNLTILRASVRVGAWRGEMKPELLAWGPGSCSKHGGSAARTVGVFRRAARTGRPLGGQYSDYLRCGFPIGSGAVAGAGKHLVSDPFKGGAPRWKLATAELVSHLRAALLTQPRLDLLRSAAAPAAAVV